ncbi:MAG: ABC transporter permease [Thermoplasmata archaeon]
MKLVDRLFQGYTFLVYVFLYTPIAVMVIFSFNTLRSVAVWGGFTLDWYAELLNRPGFWATAYTTFWIGGVVTVVSVVMGTLMAYGVTRFRLRMRPLIMAVIYLPIVIPEIAESLSLLLLYVFLNVPLSAWTVVLGHIAFDISFVTVVVHARMAGFDRSVEEAAKTLGANEIQTFFRITLPILMPGILAGGLLAFTLSFDDLIKTLFVRGPGVNTIPTMIWSQAARGGVSPDLNALSTFALMISLVFAFSRSRLERSRAS